jgi:small ligand-binding sensory domain FIST
MNATRSGAIRCAAHLSTAADAVAAATECCASIRRQLGGPASLVFLFASPHHGEQLGAVATLLGGHLETDRVLGCTGESIVGGGREIEAERALAVWAAVLPDVSLDAFPLVFTRTAEGGAIEGWPDAVLGEWPAGSALLILGDPFSFPADLLAERLSEDRPGVPLLGGMASGGNTPGETRLVLGADVRTDGAVAVLLRGPAGLRSVVSQGCRPIGKPFVVTKTERNVLLELGGLPALSQLKKVFDELPNREKQLFQRGLHVGRVVSEYRESFEAGDFLVRNVLGIDPRNGSIVAGDFFRPGQTVQFHLRDHETADDDLKQLLRGLAQDQGVAAAGALIFTCNGRGTHLFPQPDHDARCLAHALGPIPAAGFFAAGELGPVGDANFMHGFTASIAVFTNPREASQ